MCSIPCITTHNFFDVATKFEKFVEYLRHKYIILVFTRPWDLLFLFHLEICSLRYPTASKPSYYVKHSKKNLANLRTHKRVGNLARHKTFYINTPSTGLPHRLLQILTWVMSGANGEPSFARIPLWGKGFHCLLE